MKRSKFSDSQIIDAGLVGDLMMQAVENQFGTNAAPTKPIKWLTDNGSC
jgi:hypothetical protein